MLLITKITVAAPVRFGPASAMPPVRAKQSQNVGSSTTKQERKKRRHNERLKEGAPLGMSKIKSALRQTRRLLSKVQRSWIFNLRDLVCTHMQQDALGADVRIESERKLKALEADLAVAERANKERALATRYHKVKFFGAYCASYLPGAFSNEDQIVRNSCAKSGRQKGESRKRRSLLRFGKPSRQSCLIYEWI